MHMPVCACDTRGDATHRPLLTQATVQQRSVNRKRQPSLAVVAFTARNQRTHAQRVVQVGRMHSRALMRRTCPKQRSRSHTTSPSLHERAVSGAVLQPDRRKAVVQRAHSSRMRTPAATQRRAVNALLHARRGEAAHAVHLRVVLRDDGLPTAHLELAVAH